MQTRHQSRPDRGPLELASLSAPASRPALREARCTATPVPQVREPKAETKRVRHELALEHELSLAGARGPRAGDFRTEEEAPGLAEMRGEEDTAEQADRMGAGRRVLAGSVVAPVGLLGLDDRVRVGRGYS